MLRYMVDTNTCIYVMRRTSQALMETFDQALGSLCISSVTYGELWFGAAKSDRKDKNLASLSVFAAQVEVLSFDRKAAEHFGEIRAQLERDGTPCGPFDMQIGAHARSLDLTVVTNNRREFDRMPGLRVENWV